MTTENLPTMYRCGQCGVFWAGSHTCPTLPSATGAQPFRLTIGTGTLEQILGELKAIRALLESRKP